MEICGVLRESSQMWSLPVTGLIHLLNRREFIANIFLIKIRTVLGCQ